MPDPDPGNPAASLPPRTRWQRRVVDPIVAQLTQGLTPRKIALTIAIGSALALFPILGTTTLLCVAAGVVLKLNQPILQAVNIALTPLHLPVIYFSFHWGSRIFGSGPAAIDFSAMQRELLDQPWQFIQDYSRASLHAIEFWAVAMPLLVLVVFYTSWPILRGIENARLAALARSTAEKARDHPVP